MVTQCVVHVSFVCATMTFNMTHAVQFIAYTFLLFIFPCFLSLFPFPSLSPPPSSSGLGVQVEPHKRQLHVTMAHQYPPEQHDKLDELAQSLVDPHLPAKWELRLYSRDIRLATSEVYIDCVT